MWVAHNGREHDLGRTLLLLECGHAGDEVAACTFEQTPERPATHARASLTEGEIV